MEGCHAGIKIVTPHLVQRDELLVMGMEVCTSHRREMNSATADIPHLWNRFVAEQLWLDIPDCVNSQVLYGVYTNYSSDRFSEHLAYSLIVAVEVSSIDNPLENMVGITIPAGSYLVFSWFNSPVPSVLHLWQQIWHYFASNSCYQRAFATDFEVYEPGQVSIFIGVK